MAAKTKSQSPTKKIVNQQIKKHVAALRRAITALENERAQYAAGHFAYAVQGIRPDVLKAKGMSGTAFLWVEKDFQEYERINKTIQELEDLIEIISDPDPVIDRDPNKIEFYTQGSFIK